MAEDWIRSATEFFTKPWADRTGKEQRSFGKEKFEQPATGGMQPGSWDLGSSQGIVRETLSAGSVSSQLPRGWGGDEGRHGSPVYAGRSANAQQSSPISAVRTGLSSPIAARTASHSSSYMPARTGSHTSGQSAPSISGSSRVGAGSLEVQERIELLEAANTALMQQLHNGYWNNEGEDRVESRTELKGDCWVITGWENDDTTVDAGGQDVHVCRNVGTGREMINVKLTGECKFICAEDNVAMLLTAEMTTMAVLILRCTKCQIVLGGEVPSVTLRDCINVEIIVGDAAVMAGIETVGCYGIVVTTVPQSADCILSVEQLLNSQQKSSMPIPERLTTTLINGSMFTTCSRGKSAANRAVLSMNT